jgi:anti-sigma B factor antagonist
MSDQAVPITPVVVLPAEIDVTNADEAYQRLVDAMGLGVRTVIADMMSTSFCDSAGVHAIMRAHERADSQGIGLRLAVSPDGSVRRVLQLTGAVLVMAVHSSVAEAMHAA